MKTSSENIMSAFTTPSGDQENQSEQLSTEELCSRVEPPTTGLEILRNIRFAMNNHLLLREDFYHSELLTTIFGAREVELSEPDRSSPKCFVGGSLSNFDDIVPRTTINGVEMEGAAFSLDRIYENGILTTGWIRINIYSVDDFSYENLIRVFGPANKIGPNLVKSQPQGKVTPKQSTHRFANQTMEYMVVSENTRLSISMDLDSDGRLSVGSYKATQNR
jgi:hypothetical protein